MSKIGINRRGPKRQDTSRLIPEIDIERRKKISGEISKVS